MTVIADEGLVWRTTLELLAFDGCDAGGPPPGAEEGDRASGRPLHDERTDEPLGGI